METFYHEQLKERVLRDALMNIGVDRRMLPAAVALLGADLYVHPQSNAVLARTALGVMSVNALVKKWAATEDGSAFLSPHAPLRLASAPRAGSFSAAVANMRDKK